MTRAEAKEQLIKLGIAEPTDEAVTNFLNTLSNETSKNKDANAKLKELEAELAEKNAKLDEIEHSNLSEIEKANKAVETANARIAELEKASRIADTKANAMAKFNITQEQVDKVIGEDGDLDFDVLSEIIKEKETASANAKEKELANGASNPSGGTGGASGDNKTTAEKLLDKISPENNGNSGNDVISHYLG